jgi:hypothetical protein
VFSALLIGFLFFLPVPAFLVPAFFSSQNARVQYISALVVAFLAGLGFDIALKQLLQRVKEKGEQITQNF